MASMRSATSIDLFEVIFEHFLTHIGRYIIQNLTNVGLCLRLEGLSAYKSYTSVAVKKVSYHMTIMIRIDGDRFYSVVFEEVRYNHTFGSKQWHETVTFSGCNVLSSIIWGSLEPQILQICLLTCPPNVKYASSLKKILFEKLPSTAYCSSTHSTYQRRCELSAHEV